MFQKQSGAGVWALSLCAFCLAAIQARFFVYDDAYISFRYAQNLVHHGELVWNLGERVEGYTNFLYVVVLSGLMSLSLDALVAARLVNALAVLALVLLYWRCARQILPETDDTNARALGGLLLLGSAALPVWMLGSLEAVLVAALILGGIERLLPLWLAQPISFPRVLTAGVLFASAYLTRPDALVFVASFTVCLALVAPVSFRVRWQTAGLVLVCLCFTIAIHMGWRFSYYDALLPNTFQAKVGVPITQRISFGSLYLMKSLVETPVFLFVLVGLLIDRLGASQVRSGGALFRALGWSTIAGLCYVLWAGGDHLPLSRFLVPLLGPGAVLAALVFSWLRDGWRRGLGAVACIAVLVGSVIFPPSFHGGAEAGRLVGQHIQKAFPKETVIALNVAGATPFVARDLRFIDMLGLNDRVIAGRYPVPMRTVWQRRPGHAKGDGDYILSRRPDIIIIGGAIGRNIAEPWFLGEVELAENPEFHSCYALKTDEIPILENDWARSAGFRSSMPFTYYQRICP